MSKKSFLCSIVLCFFFVSCEEGTNDWYAVVTSDTGWEGDFSAQHIVGNGNQTVDLPDDLPGVCCAAQKKTEQGYLKVEVRNRGSNPTSPGGEWDETREPYGMVSVCSGNK